MSKRKLDEIDEIAVDGYIHMTNSVRKAKASDTRYFDGTIQTSSMEFVRYISFSPEKFDNFMSAQNMKTPVKLKNVRLLPKAGKKELCFGRHSSIELCKKLDFCRKSEVKKSPPPEKCISEITEGKMTVSVKAKMSGFFDVENEVQTKYGRRKLQTAILADKTGVIKLTLWEDNINRIVSGNYYLIENVVSNTFKGNIQLSTTSDTTFTIIEPIEDVKQDYSSLEKVQSATGKMDFCSLSSQLKCMHCFKQLETNENQVLAKCPSCGVKQKVSSEQMTSTLKFQLKTDDDEKKKLIMFSSAIENFKQLYNLQQKTDDEIEDFLLTQDKLKICTDNESDIVNKIEII